MKRSTLALSLFVTLAAACSSTTETTTGFTPDGPSTGKPGTGATGTGATGSGSTGSGSTGNTGGSGNTGGNTGGSGTATVDTYVAGLTINEIAVYQAVKVDVVASGAKVSQTNAPIVAGRQGTIRVYVTPGSGYDGRSVAAELRLYAGSATTPTSVLHDTKSITAASTDADTSSTFDFDFAGTDVPEGVKFVVALTDPKGSNDATTGSVYPKGATPDTLGATNSGVVKVTLVPVQYMADGSGRLPDTSAAQLALYKQEMMTHYPVTDVQITVRAPWQNSTKISASGTNWDTLLTAVTNLRKQDNAADDVYYFAAFSPAASFDSFCQSGCVAGLSTVADENDADYRASIGLGYTGQDSTVTMAHEVGHAHGRNHAPCGGATGVDPSFPYSTGGIGVNGYDIIAKTFISSSSGKDIMGYCTPEWISDYTFSALFTRVAYVNGAKEVIPGPATAYRLITERPDGTLVGGNSVTLTQAPTQESSATFVDSNGTTVSTVGAHFVPFDHLKGGFWVVPEGPTNTVQIKGQTLSLP